MRIVVDHVIIDCIIISSIKTSINEEFVDICSHSYLDIILE